MVLALICHFTVVNGPVVQEVGYLWVGLWNSFSWVVVVFMCSINGSGLKGHYICDGVGVCTIVVVVLVVVVDVVLVLVLNVVLVVVLVILPYKEAPWG